MAWYKRLRVRRINRLTGYGFLREETINLTALKTRYTSGRTITQSIVLGRPYIQMMLRDRLAKYRQAQRDGLSLAEYKRQIYKDYADKGWIKPDGTPDYWAMIRWNREEAIRQGKETGSPPPKPRVYDPSKPHKKLTPTGKIDKEYIAAQRKQYQKRDTASGKPSKVSKSQWIEQLRESARTAKTPERQRQFEQQIRRLGGTV